MDIYPKITPDLEGTRYCVPCLWNGARHPERKDDRIYVIRFSADPLDTKSVCHAHLADFSVSFDLPKGYRWAREDETERSDAIVVHLTFDSSGKRYTQDEADLAVPK